jgi:hypothetical protein
MAVKLFKVPFTHPYIQNLTEFDLLLINESMNLDNPEYRRKVTNTFFDEDFDEYADEVEDDDLTPEEKAQMEEIIRQHNESKSDDVPSDSAVDSDEFSDMSDTSYDNEVDDWEDV